MRHTLDHVLGDQASGEAAYGIKACLLAVSAPHFQVDCRGAELRRHLYTEGVIKAEFCSVDHSLNCAFCYWYLFMS